MDILDFFKKSDQLDYLALGPLSHIRGNWELVWDYEENKYKEEEDSYARMVNTLILELGECNPPNNYHDNEDRLAEYVKANLKWSIRKENGRWTGMNYERILEQGGYGDINERELVLAAAGRIYAAIKRGQLHFDDMEPSHQRMLASVVAVILYHRTDI